MSFFMKSLYCFSVLLSVVSRIDKDSSMTVDWDEFLQHIILNPVDNIGELVSSWKHSLVRQMDVISTKYASMVAKHSPLAGF